MKLFSASILLFNLLRAEAGRDGFRGLKKDSKAGKSDDFSFYLSFDYDSKSGKGMSSSKSGKVSKAGKSGTVGDLLNPDCDFVQEEAYFAQCESFCTEFFDVCVNPNFVNSRMGWDECVEQCTQWPRVKTIDTRPPNKYFLLMSDTYECRDIHLFEAQINEDPDFAAFHCNHMFDPNEGICVDAKIDGKKTPYEMLRDGACTHHHYGYCDLSGEDTVADCMKASIDDNSLQYALQMLPPTIEVIFLSQNEGITKLESGIFNNLTNPLGLKALFMDDCNITTIDEDVFHPLKNLQVLNMVFNKISVIQDDLLKLPELKQFKAYGDPTAPGDIFGPNGGTKPGQIADGGFTNKIFQHTPKLQYLFMFAQNGITELPAGLFNGLSKVESMYWVFCSLTNAGIPDGLWEPLVSLRHLDMQGNLFTELDPDWFGTWFSNMERLLFFSAGPNTMDLAPIVDKTIFNNMPKLKDLHLEGNARLNTLTPDFFTKNPDLRTLTL